MRHFGFRGGILHVFDDVREIHNLPLAHQLLGQVRFKVLDFLRQGTHQVRLLQALGIHQFVLAELQDEPVIQAEGQHADHQKRAQDKPKNAHLPCAQAFPEAPKGLSGGRHLTLNFRVRRRSRGDK